VVAERNRLTARDSYHSPLTTNYSRLTAPGDNLKR
jgi:hypothetical protein